MTVKKSQCEKLIIFPPVTLLTLRATYGARLSLAEAVRFYTKTEKGALYKIFACVQVLRAERK